MINHHALIIDDNMKNVTVLAQLLAEHGVTSTPMTNPKLIDGIMASISSLDLVFCDLEMPGLNGYDVLDRLKADTRFGKVPVVAYTVHASEIHVAQQRGFDSFIGKPINADRFPEQLARLLRHESVWETA